MKRDTAHVPAQGSILSPYLWRLFDNVYSHMYKNSLDILCAENADIWNEYLHVSYADDHVTVICVIVESDVADDDVQTRINQVVDTTRLLLDSATRDVGCGVNAHFYV